MPKHHAFARDEQFPSWFANAIQEFLSGAVTDIRLRREDDTHVTVPVLEPLGISAVPIQGRWRYRTAAVSRAHPGGAAGTYTVWAVGLDNDVDDSPDPHTDHTTYDFDLRITDGTDPAGAGVEVFDKLGEVGWDGDSISFVRQTYGEVEGPQLASGALSASSPITKTRQPDGSYLLELEPLTEAAYGDASVSSRAMAPTTDAFAMLGSIDPLGGAYASFGLASQLFTPDFDCLLMGTVQVVARFYNNAAYIVDGTITAALSLDGAVASEEVPITQRLRGDSTGAFHPIDDKLLTIPFQLALDEGVEYEIDLVGKAAMGTGVGALRGTAKGAVFGYVMFAR